MRTLTVISPRRTPSRNLFVKTICLKKYKAVGAGFMPAFKFKEFLFVFERGRKARAYVPNLVKWI
jgi:hypothetical protein